jgi:hypothetical protein
MNQMAIHAYLTLGSTLFKLIEKPSHHRKCLDQGATEELSISGAKLARWFNMPESTGTHQHASAPRRSRPMLIRPASPN